MALRRRTYLKVARRVWQFGVLRPSGLLSIFDKNGGEIIIVIEIGKSYCRMTMFELLTAKKLCLNHILAIRFSSQRLEN